MFRIDSRRVVLLILLAGGLATRPSLADDQDRPSAAAGRTIKERLSDKASDEQRVNDCKVPPVRRTHARPADCGL